MEVMYLMAPVILALSTVVLLGSSVPIASLWEGPATQSAVWYRVQFVTMIVTCAVFGGLSKSYLDKTDTRVGKGTMYVGVFVVVMVGINLWITVLDYESLGRYFFLIMALFVIFGLFFIPPVFTLLCLVGVFVTMGMAFWFKGLMAAVDLLILFSYLLIILVVSASNYLARVRAGNANERAVRARGRS